MIQIYDIRWFFQFPKTTNGPMDTDLTVIVEMFIFSYPCRNNPAKLVSATRDRLINNEFERRNTIAEESPWAKINHVSNIKTEKSMTFF